MTSPPAKEKPINSLLAGAVAGAVEATITYPTEYVKTQVQLQGASPSTANRLAFKGPLDCVAQTVRTQGITALYRGLSAMVIGTAAKAGVRFLSYDFYKAQLADERGQLTGSRSLLAGLAAGMTEAFLVVTPTEAIKTKLIHDQNLANPQYRGLVHGVSSILRQQGLPGIYSGLFAVMLRQGANAAVRFSAYNAIKQWVINRKYPTDDPAMAPPPNLVLPWTTTFMIGMAAGTITVYTTMPVDVLKTKMQGINAKALYRNSFHCVWRTFQEEGVLAFWKGATPRLSRLMFSGGIVFSVYEQVIAVMRAIN
ncbi:hypothetical protein H4R33_004760 [Dimargaris cristalligena]|uniref:Mitochondrial tricarboxylate transporter n=1 Tax=Dimargaris cristalligena TaxID=215637 RepID=A0A4P9ZV65_9FUNG|nr:hypothetical protein H4R33_004760 [Dimargaris cristalligena]RKP36510.1 mitochondrial tricarboxylate transporter [Dimargaris cristalligena]|eukprot:RKP36510.1 mitochondrial tricarboxylate transporter [Dimargaris cristalligena]